jgi:quercetin dioxygenase-like cupin family protein
MWQCRCFWWEVQPGQGAPLHFHDYDEIILVQEGVSRLVAGDEVREVSANDVIVIKAGTPHGFVNIGAGVLRQADIHVSPRFHQENLAPTATSRRAGLPQ